MTRSSSPKQKLKKQIQELKNFPYIRTQKRLKTVFAYKQKPATQQSVAESHGVSSSSVGRWNKRYEEGGIVDLIISESSPYNISKRDTSNDENLKKSLKKDIAKLKSSSEDWKNTIDRAQAALNYLENNKFLKKIARKLNTTEKSVLSWLKMYSEEGGINRLKLFNNQPITKLKRDTSNDKVLKEQIAKEIKELKKRPKKWKNTITRACAVHDYLEDPTKRNLIAHDAKVSVETILRWCLIYTEKNGIEGLKLMEDQFLIKPVRETSNDQNLKGKLKKEIAALKKNPKKWERTIKRAQAIVDYIEMNKSLAQIAKDTDGVQPESVVRWWKLSSEKNGINKLKGLENTPLTKTRRDTSNDTNLKGKLKKEIAALKKNPKKWERTIKRAQAVYDYLDNKKNKNSIAEKLTVHPETIPRWAKMYARPGGGINELKKLNDSPLSKSRNYNLDSLTIANNKGNKQSNRRRRTTQNNGPVAKRRRRI